MVPSLLKICIIYIKLVYRKKYLCSYFTDLGLRKAIKIDHVWIKKLGIAGQLSFFSLYKMSFKKF